VDTTTQFNAVVDLFGRLGVQVRREHLGGRGGGLCQVHGHRVIFVDLDADAATQMEVCVRALSSLPELETVYVPPVLRELIDRIGS
jgi:hypothetical protein